MSDSRIVEVHARQIYDSRGNPTVEVDVMLEDKSQGRAAVPSGASTGAHEACELRDGGNRFKGKGVLTAVNNVNTEIRSAVRGMYANQQKAIDTAMRNLDGTPNKGRLGANAILAVSLAVARAEAASKGIPLWKLLHSEGTKFVTPAPMANLINGGAHGGGNSMSMQEAMIMPLGFDTFSEAMECINGVFHTLAGIMKKNRWRTSVGDEGGFAPDLKSDEEALQLLMQAIEQAGYKPGEQVFLALDVASTEFFDAKTGIYTMNGKQLKADEMIGLYSGWLDKYPIRSIEDGLAEDDWEGWRAMTSQIGKRVQLVGDDLFVTNPSRLSQGIEQNVANSILVKVNQIGSLTETIDAVLLALRNGYTAVMSHRSGETEDTTIADLAVALSTGQIKTGSCSRTDRMAKYNQLLRIEEMLQGMGEFSYGGRSLIRK